MQLWEWTFNVKIIVKYGFVSGRNDFAEASRYIQWQFEQRVQQNRTVNCHITKATDTGTTRQALDSCLGVILHDLFEPGAYWEHRITGFSHRTSSRLMPGRYSSWPLWAWGVLRAHDHSILTHDHGRTAQDSHTWQALDSDHVWASFFMISLRAWGVLRPPFSISP